MQRWGLSLRIMVFGLVLLQPLQAEVPWVWLWCATAAAVGATVLTPGERFLLPVWLMLVLCMAVPATSQQIREDSLRIMFWTGVGGVLFWSLLWAGQDRKRQ